MNYHLAQEQPLSLEALENALAEIRKQPALNLPIAMTKAQLAELQTRHEADRPRYAVSALGSIPLTVLNEQAMVDFRRIAKAWAAKNMKFSLPFHLLDEDSNTVLLTGVEDYYGTKSPFIFDLPVARFPLIFGQREGA
jgi:hypothetical protein